MSSSNTLSWINYEWLDVLLNTNYITDLELSPTLTIYNGEFTKIVENDASELYDEYDEVETIYLQIQNWIVSSALPPTIVVRWDSLRLKGISIGAKKLRHLFQNPNVITVTLQDNTLNALHFTPETYHTMTKSIRPLSLEITYLLNYDLVRGG